MESQPLNRDRPALGIGLSILAMLLLASMDALSKYLTQHHPIPQILFVRFVVFFACALTLAARQGGIAAAVRSTRPALQLLRSAVLIVEIFVFITAFSLMPLADVHAIAAASPLLVTALAVPLLGERVGLHRWGAVAVGFIGVLVIIRPGAGVMDQGAPVALAGAALWALYQILVRRIGQSDPAATTVLYTAATGLVVTALAAPFFWVPPAPIAWLQLGVLGVLGFAGHSVLILALREAPASMLQPFGYMLLVWAIVMGWLVFGELPDAVTLAGAGIVVASGLYTVHRERRRARPVR